MENLHYYLMEWDAFIWGIPLLTFLMGTGLYLTYLLRAVQFRYLGYAIQQVFAKSDADSQGDISHFQSLMTSLAGAIGTGTIVGIATGITIGGLGSIFWMWVTAFIGMATKYAESLLAVKYRQLDDQGEIIGGPMQYIERGVGWKWMAILFAILGAIAALGTGNLVQVNAIADSIDVFYQINPWIKGIAIAFLAGIVIIGGVKSIGHVAGVLVPIMALFYMAAGLYVILINYALLPTAFYDIIARAFTGQAAFGGFTGATLLMAIQAGVSRSVFSNEAGLGISTIAAAAAKTNSPGRQGLITMTGALVSTVIVCSVTGLVLAVTGVHGKLHASGAPLNGVSMTVHAFESAITGGGYIVSLGLILFAFTTVIAWGYYGEKCCEYLFGSRAIFIYRLLFILVIIPGAAIKMEAAWLLANISNGLMAIPNLIAILMLSPVVKAETVTFLNLIKQEQTQQKTHQEKLS